MTDREMLELAARAAGLPWDQWVIDGDDRWDPLKHKSDAFDLMVELELRVTPYPVFDRVKNGVVVERCVVFPSSKQFFEPYNNDPTAATMRAITRAAAEIGRAMNTTGEQK